MHSETPLFNLIIKTKNTAKEVFVMYCGNKDI